jgi:CRISPR type I-E-associated protein CasB/Cse2
MTQSQPFITYLESLREDRGALAALRRGLGQPPGTAREMYPYVVRWLPAEASAQREAAYFLVAALFAYHPNPNTRE